MDFDGIGCDFDGGGLSDINLVLAYLSLLSKVANRLECVCAPLENWRFDTKLGH